MTWEDWSQSRKKSLESSLSLNSSSSATKAFMKCESKPLKVKISSTSSHWLKKSSKMKKVLKQHKILTMLFDYSNFIFLLFIAKSIVPKFEENKKNNSRGWTQLKAPKWQEWLLKYRSFWGWRGTHFPNCHSKCFCWNLTLFLWAYTKPWSSCSWQLLRAVFWRVHHRCPVPVHFGTCNSSGS